MNNMSITLALAAYNETAQVVIPKSIVSDPGQFDSDQTKFENQQREIRLFLKSNRVNRTNNRITVILA